MSTMELCYTKFTRIAYTNPRFLKKYCVRLLDGTTDNEMVGVSQTFRFMQRGEGIHTLIV